MKDLTVEIPRKHKKALIERFGLKNAKKQKGMWIEEYWTINKSCPLCINYPFCVKCPFTKFRNTSAGCIGWIYEVLDCKPNFSIWANCIEWLEENDKKARKELKLLKKKARKLIKWV